MSPAVSVVDISDPTAVGEAIEVITLDAVQLASTPLRARRAVVRLGSSVLVYHSTNRAIRTRTTLQHGLVAFVAFGARAEGTANGLPVGRGRVLACAAGIEVEFVVAAGYDSIAFLVAPDELRARLRGRRREDQHFIPHGVELLQASPDAAAALYTWGRRVIDTAARQPSVLEAPKTQSAAQVELLEVLMATLSSAASAELTPDDRTRRTHGQIVRAAEDYAMAHTGDRLYVTDLCQAADVSERTLQYAFKEVMAMTPVAYLTRLRLHRVRQALRAASPKSTTVTAEALKWGFWHFGDFSRAYKHCFRELPSVTLRRGG